MTLETIAEIVKREPAGKIYSMKTLKEEYQPSWSNLSTPRSEAIRERLRTLGITTLPPALPTHETKNVFLCAVSTDLGRIIEFASFILTDLARPNVQQRPLRLTDLQGDGLFGHLLPLFGWSDSRVDQAAAVQQKVNENADNDRQRTTGDDSRPAESANGR